MPRALLDCDVERTIVSSFGCNGLLRLVRGFAAGDRAGFGAGTAARWSAVA